MLQGVSASPGVAIGRALLFTDGPLSIPKQTISNTQIEVGRFKRAIQDSKVELEKVRDQALEELGKEKAQIFDSHLLLLEDPELFKQTIKKIEDDKVNVDWAFQQVSDQFIAVFEQMDDDYMRERASDIKDISKRILLHLTGQEVHDLSTLKRPVVIITDDLSPSQTATMKKDMVLGFVTNTGGKTSHSAIMARTLEIPAVVGTGQSTDAIKNGDLVIIDGLEGQVIINPDDHIVHQYKMKQAQENIKKDELQELCGQETKTLDGHQVELAGNIGTPNDIEALERNDAEAVGLYRTEFLFMDRPSIPTEQEQYEAYTKVIKSLNGKNCIIRTLDIGGDKQLDYLHVGEEMNPFLGYRAIRICLKDKKIFKPQLRALLRAGVHGPLGIMFPMISCLEELLEAKSVLEECKAELKSENIDYTNQVRVGIMIEVPSAAMMSDILAKHADFFSIGTNDLTQYSCAVDRMNEKIEHLYNPFNPGLLRLIHLTITNARNNNIMAAMCGSMARIPELVPFFLGAGLEEFSMSPMHILPTRKIIRSLNYEECKKIIPEVLALGTTDEVKAFLGQYIKQAL
jgi:phosphoenolpyruvate-protein phosphotransferase (PTS system enzyme I)